MRVGNETPWGEAQQVTEYPHGIYWVDTAGHGGFLVPIEYAKDNMDKRYLLAANDFVDYWPGQNKFYAFEEDCAASAVVASFEDIREIRYQGRISKEQIDQWFEESYGDRIG